MTGAEDPADVAARLTGHRVLPGSVPRGASGLAEVTLDGVGTVVVKRGSDPRSARAEAAGLRWLAGADAVRLPEVRGADDDWLVVDRVETGAATPEAAEELGRELAALHAAGVPAFGAPPPGGPADAWIGRAPMANRPGDRWPRWYAEHRVLPYLREAVDRGAMGTGDAALVERVCDRLPELAGPDRPPARLHGDLWNGNVLWGADGHVRLIDPAAHGGHRETDLAMLRLFGCPHLDRVLDAYDRADPLDDGWRGRVGLHQLFPLLVHTVLFGGGYAAQAVAAARSALRG
ncbi:fructosamine kinase family protein [Streptomyces sp. PTM05]|uniref:Fructosamine kinase family protein n=1 Tax=Streptantibioticus parmotrematis TaxID=2873249 RepID=A0ABS7QL68_9ACTN|nr:fructosamine kinase family protein [Streptantibioticus parmotrematis]MBY8883501.1 fructosamine kinase family protein [Streptantibioticus parmotrematis]